MKKKVILLMMAMSLMTCTVACGEAEEEEESKVSSEESTETEETEESKESEVSQEESSETAEESSEEVSSETTEESTVEEVKEPEVTPSVENNRESELLTLYTGSEFNSAFDENLFRPAVNIKYGRICLSDASAKQYPELDKALKQLNADEEAIYQDGFKRMTTEVEDLISQGIDEEELDMYLPYYDESYYAVTRADSRVLSILVSNSFYSGGAHGMYGKIGLNYDTKTGKILAYKDVFNDVSALSDVIYEELCEQYDKGMFWEQTPEYIHGSFIEGDSPIAWGMDYQGVVIYFNPYEIASFADGIIAVRIDYKDHPELFKPEFMEVPTSYAMGGDEFNRYVYDFNNDGKIQNLAIYESSDESGFINTINIELDGKENSFEIWSYRNEYYIANIEGKSYLYVNTLSESDWQSAHVYDLSNDEVIETEVTGNRMHYGICIDEENYKWVNQLFTDPSAYEMNSRFSILETFSAHRTYALSKNGTFVSDAEWYVADNAPEIEVKKAFSGELVENGNPTGQQYEIKEGDLICVCGTNGKDIVDVLDGDKVIRLHVEAENWPQTIDGVPLEDLFVNLFFAG